jgi:glycerophosphoryl diester phosphodiesterase
VAIVIAHRGAPLKEVENSLAAFRAAVADGADGIEFDVHDTADGGLVVHHDPEVDGVPFRDLTLDEARGLYLSNGEPIPTLAETLDQLGPRVTAFIEVKSLWEHHDESLFRVIDAAPDPTHCHVHAFDHRIVRRLARQRDTLTVGVLQSAYPVEPTSAMVHAGATELWQEAAHIDEAVVEAVHALGGKIYAWTVDDEPTMRALLALGVDGLCSNKPDLAREVVG